MIQNRLEAEKSLHLNSIHYLWNINSLHDNSTTCYTVVNKCKDMQFEFYASNFVKLKFSKIQITEYKYRFQYIS